MRLGIAILILAGTLPLSAMEKDLSGTWQLRLISCLPSEKICATKIDPQNLSKLYSVKQPGNLHADFPWFYGEAELTHEFDYTPNAATPIPDVLLLGSIGSADQTYLNEILVGALGVVEQNSAQSAWNEFRSYRIPAGALRTGKNLLRIRFWVLDVKAGVHAGPVELTTFRDSLGKIFIWRLLREFIWNAIPVMVMITILVLIVTFRYWQRNEGNHYLIYASIGYFVHSMYYFPFPSIFDYQLFLKMQWSGRIISVIFTTLYFLSNFQIHDKLAHGGWMLVGLAAILWTALSSSYAALMETMRWQQWLFLIHLAYPLVYWKRMAGSPRRQMYIRFHVIAILVGALYVNDALVLGSAVMLPWLYHYLSLVNIVNFFDHYSYQLFLWRERGRQMGESTASVRHLREKLNMAHELHDVVGAQLSQIVALSDASASSEKHANLNELASSSLEKIRNFAHILKGETETDELPLILEKLADRLKALGRHEVLLHISAAQTGARALSGDQRHHIERILSEWSSNVIRHARGAKRLELGCRVRRGRVTVFFYQDAPAFSWRGKADRGGLLSMRRRATAIKADIQCRHVRGGALLIVAIPMTKTHG